MNLGPLLAILAGAAFAASEVLVRKATHRAEESFSALAIVLFVGVVLFAPIFPVSRDWNRLLALSWQGFALLGVAGIIHYALGRYLFYNSIRFIGANIASAISRIYLLFAIVLGVVFLQETVTVFLVLGAIGIMAGVVLVSFHKEEIVIRFQTKGVLFCIGDALCIAVTSVLIRVAMQEIGSPYAATFISYVAAFFIVAVILMTRREQRRHLFQLSRSQSVVLVIAGVFTLGAQVLRYAALNFSPVSIVTPLMATLVLFTFFFSFLINRRIDVFTRRVFVGMLLVLGGSFLLFL